MSVRVMSVVWDSTVPAPQRLTLLALADRADEDGYCWPSVATLVQKCRSGESTIRRHLKELEELGVLRIVRRTNKSSEYWIQLDRLRQATPRSETTSQSEGSQIETTTPQSEQLGGPRSSGGGSQIETQYINEPSVDTSEIRVASRKRERQPRATRIPEDFTVTSAMVAWAQENVPHVDGRRATAMFIDHFRAASGANARKLDWVAAWRNWMRKADTSPGVAARPARRTTDDKIAAVGTLFEERRRRRATANNVINGTIVPITGGKS